MQHSEKSSTQIVILAAVMLASLAMFFLIWKNPTIANKTPAVYALIIFLITTVCLALFAKRNLRIEELKKSDLVYLSGIFLVVFLGAIYAILFIIYFFAGLGFH
jgi:hypothetical protein